jgi:hypothetical protein
MTEERFVAICGEIRTDGERAGLGLAVSICQAHLDGLNNPTVAAMYQQVELDARRDQVDQILRNLLDQQAKL